MATAPPPSQHQPFSPTPDASTKKFWEAARAGQLLIGRNMKTGAVHYPPRPVCPISDEGEIEYVPAADTGRIYSFSIMRAQPPYVIAYVELVEGICVLTNLVDCDAAALQIGQEVKLVFRPSAGDGQPVPMFTTEG